MSGNGNRQAGHGTQAPEIIKNQREITSTAVDIIRAVVNKRGRPLQPRDRMALKLLTPQNSALVVKDGVKNLGCRQVSFDIVTDDVGRGIHRLMPSGLHVYNPQSGWWSDRYGTGQFLWNLLIREEPVEGMTRILERLFKFKMKGILGSKADVSLAGRQQTIAAELRHDLRLFIKRDEGRVETTLRRMIKSRALHSPRELGLHLPDQERGQVILIFGKKNNYGISFSIERL